MNLEPYILIPFARYTSIVEGGGFNTTRRTRWEVTVNLASLEVGGNVTVIFEGSPDAQSDDTYTTLHSFGTLSTVAEVVARSFDFGQSQADFTVGPDVQFIRARVTANTGDFVLDCRGVSRFLDLRLDADVALLPQVLETSKNTRDRFVDQAESQILRWLRAGPDGSLALDTDDYRAQDIIKDAVLLQARRKQKADSLQNSGKENERRAGQSMSGDFAPGVLELLQTVKLDGHQVYRGR